MLQGLEASSINLFFNFEMEFNKINFTVIEECLSACESKDAIFAIFMASAGSLLDSELKVIRSDDLPGVLKTMPATLQITNEKAVVLILSLHSLLKDYIANDEETIVARFPEKFNKKLKVVLFKMMREVSEQAKQYYRDEFTCLPKLKEFDWRLDVKISSKESDRLKQPTLYVKMDLEQSNEVLFQVSKGQLKELLTNFEKINQQLTGLTTSMAN